MTSRRAWELPGPIGSAIRLSRSEHGAQMISTWSSYYPINTRLGDHDRTFTALSFSHLSFHSSISIAIVISFSINTKSETSSSRLSNIQQVFLCHQIAQSDAVEELVVVLIFVKHGSLVDVHAHHQVLTCHGRHLAHHPV